MLPFITSQVYTDNNFQSIKSLLQSIAYNLPLSSKNKHKDVMSYAYFKG